MSLLGKGDDFQLSGLTGPLNITSTEVRTQLNFMKVGKADPNDCPPIVARRSLGPTAIQHIVELLNDEVQHQALDAGITPTDRSYCARRQNSSGPSTTPP